MPKPICFMVMPYGKRKTNVERPGVPAEVDFDALWERVYRPTLEALGYESVRADEDTGALIIKEMIERLALSDLVLADISLSNANVYYEVGIRHAARNTGCVLVAAEWSKQPFDLDQIPNVRFPLEHGDVPETEGAAITALLERAIPDLRDGESPVLQSVPGFPDRIDPQRITSFRAYTEQMAAFQARIGAIRGAAPSQRAQRARDLLAEFPAQELVSAAMAVELLHVARDHVGWGETLEFLDSLPERLRKAPYVQEQLALARSKAGDPVQAIEALEALMAIAGETSERWGLLGGRYKKLYALATDPADREHYLQKAIESYELGVRCDLNDYYPTCNLPRLYRARGLKGDEGRAHAASVLTVAACKRAQERGASDEWLRPTLLGAAFDSGDVSEARRLVGEVRRAGSAAWKLETTLADLERSVAQQVDPAVGRDLAAALEELRGLLPKG